MITTMPFATRALVLMAVIVAACKGDNALTPLSDEPGTEGGPCTPDDTCRTPLVCYSHLCVNPSTASSGWAESGKPLSVPPSQPGFLEVVPPSLDLAVTTTVQLSVHVYDSSGTELPKPSISYDSDSPLVASVSTTGLVTATAVGSGNLIVISGDYGKRLVPVTVGATAVPRRATSVQFVPPTMVLQVDGSRTIVVKVFDGAGSELFPPPAISLTPSDSSVVTVAGTAIAGVGDGIAVITAREGDTALRGILPVSVTRRSAPTLGSGCTPGNTQTSVDGCYSYAGLSGRLGFSKPGVKARIPETVMVSRSVYDSCGLQNIVQNQQSPETVEFSSLGVAKMGDDGLMIALAPGRARYRLKVANVVCFESTLDVSPNMEGEWSGTCSNGDTGRFSMDEWAGVSGQPGLGVGASMANCYANTSDGFSCTGTPAVSYPDVFYFAKPANGGPCSPSSPCPFNMGDCAGDRHGGSTAVLGPNTLSIGGCTVTRGLSGEGCTVGPNKNDCSPCGECTTDGDAVDIWMSELNKYHDCAANCYDAGAGCDALCTGENRAACRQACQAAYCKCLDGCENAAVSSANQRFDALIACIIDKKIQDCTCSGAMEPPCDSMASIGEIARCSKAGFAASVGTFIEKMKAIGGSCQQ